MWKSVELTRSLHFDPAMNAVRNFDQYVAAINLRYFNTCAIPLGLPRVCLGPTGSLYETAYVLPLPFTERGSDTQLKFL